MNGAYFAGWGYMCFWEPRRNDERGAFMHRIGAHYGDGDETGVTSQLAPARPHTTEARRLQEITESG